MQYKQCKCGKAQRWDSGYGVQPCEGCEECQTTFAGHPEGHQPLQPHTFEVYYEGGKEPNPVQMCTRCHHTVRPEKKPAEPPPTPP